MSKWKCERCMGNVCNVELSTGYPVLCVKFYDYNPEWDEITDDAEPPKQEEELPEWCKQDAWVFDCNEREFAQVKDITGEIEDVDLVYRGTTERVTKSKKYIIDCCLQARIRPYCDQEMKRLVGRILDNGTRRVMVTACEPDNVIAKSQEVVFMADDWFTADDLIENHYYIDGKPCGRLEFNDDGEWKED